VGDGLVEVQSAGVLGGMGRVKGSTEEVACRYFGGGRGRKGGQDGAGLTQSAENRHVVPSVSAPSQPQGLFG
jgi:hypothetical protein